MKRFRRLRQNWLTELYRGPMFLRYRQRVTSDCVTILLYHRIETDHFRKHLEFLIRTYEFISLHDLARWYQGKAQLPQKSLVITFDDGWKENFNLLPVIKEFDLPITIFLTAGLVNTWGTIWNYIPNLTDPGENRWLKTIPNSQREAYLINKYQHAHASSYAERSNLNLQEIELMQPFVDFQSHGMYHPVFTNCDEDELTFELEASRYKLSNLLEHEIYAIAYPYGRAGPREQQAAERAGYKVGRKAANYGVNRRDEDPFALKSIGINSDTSLDSLDRRIAWGQLRTHLNWN